ncbi:MAG: FkbM family methyltransferase [Saprospiraceae bacterium]
MLAYFKKYFLRRNALRITAEYPSKLQKFEIHGLGEIEFETWENPLVQPFAITTEMVDFFRSYIKSGDLVIDIGAHIGDTTVPMALVAGPSGLALGFDPNPFVFKLLEKNAHLNKGLLNIIPIRNAITTQDEEFFYISSEASFANGGISKTQKSSHGKYIFPDKIQGINLLKYLEGNHADKLGKLSFVKIDTEGYDKEIIKSISDLLVKYKPTLVVESFGKAPKEAKLELYDLVSNLGYKISYFSDFSSLADLKKLKHRNNILDYTKTINIICTP